MSFIYITGAPGVGKSALQEKFKNLGYEAYDADDTMFGGAHNLATGERVSIPPAGERAPDWFSQHEWRVYVDAFSQLRTKAQDKDIFVLGVSSSDDEILHTFDKVVYLEIGEESLHQRVQSRIDNDYGKSDFEWQDIKQRKEMLDQKYAALGIKAISAEGSVDDVVKRLLAAL